MTADSSLPANRHVTVEQLKWTSVCLVLVLLTQISALPIWVTAASVAFAGIRVAQAIRGREAPPRVLRFAIALLAIGLLFQHFRTFNGLSAGTALLSLVAGLKLLETRTRRDIYVVTMIIYFLCLATLLEGESFWLLAYLIGVCWLTTSTLLRLTGPSGSAARPRHAWRSSVRYAGRLLLQAAPLALALWLFFPRFAGPLWHMPDSDSSAATGLGDTMSPGDITDLAQSDEIAFRVRFGAGGAPPPQERYWRGPVLHDFDGRTWRRFESAPFRAPPPLRYSGTPYRYTVSLEASRRHWLFVLDWPSQWNAERGLLTADYMLVQPAPLTQPIDVVATSYPEVQAAAPLEEGMRRRDLRLPTGRNPRTQRLAQNLRTAHPDDLDYVHAVLDLFRTQAFFYTLTPPRLGDDSVDAFLFDTRRGFCGHYASAFAALMRAAGIPARVVTGYQGGTYNRFADYWILHQSDAHAWDEVWVEGHGWLRVDPTAAIDPQRVERGLNDIVSAGAPLTSRWQQRVAWPWLTDTRLRLDALRLMWRERILNFDQGSQMQLLRFVHIPEPGQKLVLVLAACLIAGMAWLTWQVRRELEPRPRDPLRRAFETLCRRLAAVGLPRRPHEGAEAFASRVAGARPELGGPLLALCRAYSRLRYAASPSKAAIASFVAGVRAFRPRRPR